MPKLLGIDAGFKHMGAAVLELESDTILHAESIKTDRQAKKRGIRVADDDAERCQALARFLLGLISTWQPAGVVVELPSGGAQGARANRSMGMATGIVVTMLEATKLPAEWVTPGDAKKAATGDSGAGKKTVQEAVRRRYTWDVWPKHKWQQEHAADAASALMAAEGGTLIRTVQRLGVAG